MFSRLRNKQRGKLINYWTFFQRPCSLLKRVMHFFSKYLLKTYSWKNRTKTVLVQIFINRSLEATTVLTVLWQKCLLSFILLPIYLFMHILRKQNHSQLSILHVSGAVRFENNTAVKQCAFQSVGLSLDKSICLVFWSRVLFWEM
mgnify:CR=1 FL=1